MVSGETWESRNKYWIETLELIIKLHEKHGLLTPGKFEVSSIYIGRPGSGIPAFRRDGLLSIEDLVEEIRSKIHNPEVLKLPKAIGSVNQISSATDILDNKVNTRILKKLYEN